MNTPSTPRQSYGIVGVWENEETGRIAAGQVSRCYTSVLSPQILRAGEWFLNSGIQESSGGVARYYRSDLERNLPLSTEITGYAASAFAYLHGLTGDKRYQACAAAAARFLEAAWDPAAQAMPFELEAPRLTYFFDCGIIVRGLLAAGGSPAIAAATAKSTERDFAATDGFYPILTLPEKTPLPRDPVRWSRSSGCYQLKAALAWLDVGDPDLRPHYDRLLEDSLRSYGSFLPGHPDPLKIVDRLHPFLYFLEGLLPVGGNPRAAAALCDGIRRTAELLRQLAPQFERADVYAQLLRIRIYAANAGAAPLDRPAAEWEAAQLRSFQVESPDPRIDGGFYFGRKDGQWIPHVSPVPTAFAIQALAMWETGQAAASVI